MLKQNRMIVLSLTSLFLVMALSLYPNVATAQDASESIVGVWEGSLNIGPQSLRLVVHVSSDENGGLTSTMDSPDQGATGIPVAETTFDGQVLSLNVSSIQGTYEGTLNEDGSLKGTWSQGGQSLPLNLEKTDSPTEVKRPQEPERPFPYDEEEVFFSNDEAGISLAGTLTLPKGDGPFPAVALISGSGPQNRDEELMGHKPFFILSDHLTRNGIAVLRYDDRGVGKSKGDFSTATSHDFAGDASAAVSYLASRPEIASDKVGLIGHSEGGLIAPMVAEMSDEVAYYVMMAGPGLPGKDILILQGELIARAGGMPAPLIEKMMTVNKKLYKTAIEYGNSDDLDEHLEKAITALQDELKPEEAQAIGLVQERNEQLISQLSSPWFQYFLTYDPHPTLAKTTVPVLSIIGENDLQVPATENTAAIESALRNANNQHFEAVILPGLNHLFQTSETGAPSEYGQIEETMAPAALEKMSNWILEVTE